MWCSARGPLERAAQATAGRWRALARRPARSALLLAICVASLACTLLPATSGAKTPGEVHCYGKTCHRVSSLQETDQSVGRIGILKASYYDHCRLDRYNTCGLTSSGAVFRPDLADNAASPIYPDGTVVVAYNPESQAAAVLRINSAGPYWRDRTLDVSRAAAEKLGFRKKGVADLMVAVIKSPKPEDARYKRLRRYERVPGFIGTFPTFPEAHAAALARLELTSGMVAAASPPAVRHVEPQELFPQAILYFDAVEPEVLSPQPPPDALPELEQPQASSSAAIADAVRPQDEQREQTDVLVATVVAAAPAASVEVQAREPEYSWLGLGERFEVFIASAVYHARAPAPVPSIPPPEEWSEKFMRFAWRARQQARIGRARPDTSIGHFADLNAGRHASPTPSQAKEP